MALLLMAQAPHNNDTNKIKDGGNPIFHEFFGTKIDLNGEIRFPEVSASSGGGHGPSSATSDLGSVERQMGNHFQGVPVHGPNSEFSGAETSNRFIGRKRSNSDAIFLGMGRDRIPQVGPESVESFHLMKMLRNSTGGERPRRSHDEELSFGMQPPKPNSTSNFISQPPVDSRSDSVASKWERSLMNVGPSAQYASRLGQFATYADKVSSRDTNAGPAFISPPAADEGSRTGIKGSGILSAIDPTDGVERNTPGVILSSHRPKSGPQSTDPESSDPSSRPGLNSASRQMTIFYAGQAHVFDEVHPNKADVIMALAGSNGGSWSTTYSPKSSVCPSLNETHIPNRNHRPGFSNAALPQELRRNLSIPGSSIHGFNHGSRNSTGVSDPRSTVSGGHPGSMTTRPTRSLNQPAEPNTEGK